MLLERRSLGRQVDDDAAARPAPAVIDQTSGDVLPPFAQEGIGTFSR
jgi:hypothetical protein